MVKKTLLVILASLALAACTPKTGQSQPTTLPQTPPAGQVQITGKNDLVIQSFTFSPKTLTVKAGQAVNIMNDDSVPHTVTSRDGKSFDSGTISPGQSGTFTAPGKPGTYAFLCNFHKSMTGTLVVQ